MGMMHVFLPIIAMWIGGYGQGLNREYRKAAVWGWFVGFALCILNAATLDWSEALPAFEEAGLLMTVVVSALGLLLMLGVVMLGYICGRATLRAITWWKR